jgi:hypothetical protein
VTPRMDVLINSRKITVRFIQSVLLRFATLWNGYLEIKVADYKGFPKNFGRANL